LLVCHDSVKIHLPAAALRRPTLRRVRFHAGALTSTEGSPVGEGRVGGTDVVGFVFVVIPAAGAEAGRGGWTGRGAAAVTAPGFGGETAGDDGTVRGAPAGLAAAGVAAGARIWALQCGQQSRTPACWS
jgi:hypothetical protein